MSVNQDPHWGLLYISLMCFPVCWGGRHQRWGLRQGHSLEFGAAGSYERLKSTQLHAGEEKGIPQPVFKFRVGKSETVEHTPLEMFTFQLALFPGPATWYAVSAKREGCSFVFTSWKQLLQHLLKIFSSFVLPQRYLYCFWHERRKYALIFLQLHIQICSHIFSMPNMYVIILWIIEFAFFPLTRQEPRNQYDLNVKCQFID